VLVRECVAYPVASARTAVSSGSRDSERTFAVATTRGENLRIQCGTRASLGRTGEEDLRVCHRGRRHALIV